MRRQPPQYYCDFCHAVPGVRLCDGYWCCELCRLKHLVKVLREAGRSFPRKAARR